METKKVEHKLVQAFDQYIEADKKACCATMRFNIFVKSFNSSEPVCPWCKTKRPENENEKEAIQ